MSIRRSCIVCGATTSGGSRCDVHGVGGKRARSCITCGAPSVGDFCQRHDARAVYLDARWHAARAQARARDADTCTRPGCGRGRATGDPVEVDHVVPIVDGGAPYDVGNLVTLCVPHHRAKTAADRRRRTGRST